MKFSVDRSVFFSGIHSVQGVVSRKPTNPMLGNMLLSAKADHGLSIIATDMYLGIQSRTDRVEVDRDGRVAVAARTLSDIVRNLPDGKVAWEIDDNQQIQLSSGKVRYRLASLPADDFPALPQVEEAPFFPISAASIAALIGRTQYAISADESRPHLSAAFVQLSGDILRVVATDGHRLSKAESTVKNTNRGEFAFLLPAKAVQELRRIAEDTSAASGAADTGQQDSVEVAVSGGNGFFRRNNIELSARLTDEHFPPYEKVIPQQLSTELTLNRRQFAEALRRVSLVSQDRNPGVRLTLMPGNLRVLGENALVGEGVEELPCNYEGDELTIGFNARYILDILQSLDDNDIRLQLGGELDPGVLRSGEGSEAELLAVVMPMRI